MFRNLEIICFQPENSSNTIHIEKTEFINSRTIIRLSDKIETDSNMIVRIYKNVVSVQQTKLHIYEDGYTYTKNNTKYRIINKNNRLFLQKTTDKIPEQKCYMILTGNKINLQDIEYHVNKIFKQKYNHDKLYLPSCKQKLDDFCPINEEEILGDCSTPQQKEIFDFYKYFFDVDINDVEYIEENIDNWMG